MNKKAKLTCHCRDSLLSECLFPFPLSLFVESPQRQCFIMQGRTKGKKVVENYQIIETLEEYENDYDILLARHMTDKKFYVMKRLATENEESQALYEGLLNEASLLKMLSHDGIVKCYKMLKTPHNIYLIYSYLEGSTLEELFQQGPTILTFAQKQTIAKQLCLIITEMQKNGIAHLNIHPENIVVGPTLNIMLKEFIFAMEIPDDDDGEVDMKRKVPKSQYVAPEVRRGIACLEGDVYSFGKILKKMQFHRSKRDPKVSGTEMEKKVANVLGLIDKMVRKDRQDRLSISEVYQSLFSKVRKVKRMQSLSESNLQTSNLSRMSTSSSHRSVMGKSQFGSKKTYAEILLKVLRFRNMSYLLLKMFSRVAVDIKLNSELTVILAYLLLKKSTKLLASLGKYLHYGKNDIGIEITPKEQGKFFKTNDYYKLCELINKEVSSQKKEFDSAVETIYLNNTELLKKADFNREIKEEQVNETYFNDCIKAYLAAVAVKEGFLQGISVDMLSDLYLLQQMLGYQRIEEMFKVRILLEPPNLQDQIFVRKSREMTQEQLISQLRANVPKP